MSTKISPALRFLLIFVGGYFGMNLLYGVYVESVNPKPDAVTTLVSKQVLFLTGLAGRPTDLSIHASKPTVVLREAGQVIINVYEGCNGINVMIVFTCFLIAFGPSTRLVWFLPVGLAAIYVVNLIRVLLLYALSATGSRYFYYFHKYLFTAFIYFFVFLLWWWWVKQLSNRHRDRA